MFENLSDRLTRVVKNIKGEARITESNTQEMLREVRLALLEADVALPVVKEFITRVKDRALGEEVLNSLTPGQALVGIVQEQLVQLIGDKTVELNLAAQPPVVILMAGLQGAGKTTTTGKLAKYLKDTLKKKVLTVSADVYRPAAIEQLRTVTEQAGAEFFPSSAEQKPLDIARAALGHAKRQFFDVLILDTAGRLGIDQAMMDEIAALHAAVKPTETLFVIDAMLGQDAANTAKAFNDALPLTGVVLTKMDGDSRGGAALSVRHITGKPIKFMGVGEKLTGFEKFHPDRVASRILGMGDIVSLVEEAQKGVDQAEAMKLAKKLKSGKSFDLNDFLSQLAQMKNMGGLQGLMDKLPTQLTKGAGQVDANLAEKQMRRTEAIILSMTLEERSKPDILKASRKRRIAAGAGVQVQEVNRLLNQFDQMRGMMKQMQKGGLAKLMKKMGGMKGMPPGGMPPGGLPPGGGFKF
ncbi:signal recognition particle protein [Limnobacter litoralis]|uniref:Signal recognition particle protein n=1 Tax=Limnobacter litoralis TaxID=481366 RepID=A0ABQ5YT42_9BURK|nr:signal recognition particle protein [Limnobacter litoralis]GLR26098.1 signal recognition particle protein [Limnobacter litoralis]